MVVFFHRRLVKGLHSIEEMLKILQAQMIFSKSTFCGRPVKGNFSIEFLQKIVSPLTGRKSSLHVYTITRTSSSPKIHIKGFFSIQDLRRSSDSQKRYGRPYLKRIPVKCCLFMKIMCSCSSQNPFKVTSRKNDCSSQSFHRTPVGLDPSIKTLSEVFQVFFSLEAFHSKRILKKVFLLNRPLEFFRSLLQETFRMIYIYSRPLQTPILIHLQKFV